MIVEVFSYNFKLISYNIYFQHKKKKNELNKLIVKFYL